MQGAKPHRPADIFAPIQIETGIPAPRLHYNSFWAELLSGVKIDDSFFVPIPNPAEGSALMHQAKRIRQSIYQAAKPFGYEVASKIEARSKDDPTIGVRFWRMK